VSAPPLTAESDMFLSAGVGKVDNTLSISLKDIMRGLKEGNVCNWIWRNAGEILQVINIRTKEIILRSCSAILEPRSMQDGVLSV